MPYTPTLGLGGQGSSYGGGMGMSNYSNPLLQQDRMLQYADPQQYDPTAYIDPRQIAMQSMMMNQQMQQQMWQRQNPIESGPANLGSFVSQAVQKAGGFGAYDPSNAPVPDGAATQQNPQVAQANAAFQAHFNSILKSDPDSNIGRAMYNASAAMMTDPSFQDPVSQQVISRYVKQAVETFKFNPNEQKNADLVKTAQELSIQKAQADMMKDKMSAQFVLVDTTQDPKSNTPVNSRLSPTISMYNPDGSENPNFKDEVAQAYADARAKGAQPTLVSADKFMSDQSAAKSQQIQLEQTRAQTQAMIAQANAAGAPGANPQNDKSIEDGLYSMDIDPKDLNYKTRNYYIGAVKQAHPDYDETNFTSKKTAMTQFAPGGQVGQNLVSAGTAIQHTQSVIQAIKDLGNSDPNVVNAARNKIQTEFGLAQAPQDVATMMVPYATEVLKSISKNGGTEDERKALVDAINGGASTSQNAISALNKLQGMFLDRVMNYKQSYNSQTGRADFNQRYAGGVGSNFDSALRSHERSLYNGQTTVDSLDAYGRVPTGSPFTNHMPGDPNYGKIGIKP